MSEHLLDRSAPPPSLSRSGTKPSERSLALKRIFDVVTTIVALVLFSPLLLFIPLVIKLRYPNVPVLFGQKVIGLGGREFKMWKFSTMCADAHLTLEEMLENNPAYRKEWAASIKLRNDPRILPGIGNFLRRTSLNELPQLFNVLIGDMSLVGPRPITRGEEHLYRLYGGPNMLKARHTQRPGITGLWQATGRSDVSYEERVSIDADYLRRQSLALDLKILLQTVMKVVTRKGAV